MQPPSLRDWKEAIVAEAQQMPSAPARLSWLVGGVWTIAREAGMVRRIGFSVAALAVGALLVWLDWHPGSTNPAVPANRATLAVTLLVLVALPWVMRRVAANRTARALRGAGYAGLFALLAVLVALSRFAGSRFDHFRAFNQANWEADMRAGAIVSAVLIVGLVGGYGAVILTLTSHRSPTPPSVMATGALAGVGVAALLYSLMPLGTLRHIGNAWLGAAYGLGWVLGPLALVTGAAVVAACRSPGDEAARLRSGAVAGLCAGGVAALLLATLTITTMLLFPQHVDLLWANPNPTVPHGTQFEIQMSVGDAAIKYQAALLIGPFVGLVLGVIGGSLAHSDAPTLAPAEGVPASPVP